MALFEQDFLMRQVQYLTQLLQEIIFKKSQNQYREAVQEIRNALQKINRDNPKKFYQLSLKETLDLFITNNKFESRLAIPVAELLTEESEMLSERHHSRSRKCVLQSLLLYQKSLSEDDAAVPLDIHQRIEQLKQRVSNRNKIEEIDRILA